MSEPEETASKAKTTKSSDSSADDAGPDPATLGGALRLALGGLFFYGAALFAGGLLASYGPVAVVAQAILAEIGLSRLGVAWSEDPDRASAASTGRAARGFGMGLVAALGATLLVLGFRAGTFAPSGIVLATLARGLLSAGATAVFHELFFRGLVLRLTEKVNSLSFRVGAAGAASFAASLAQPGATLLEAAVAGTVGAALACLWLRERGAHLAMGAHAGWIFATRDVFRGGLFELSGSKNALGGLGAGPYTGVAAWIAVAIGLGLAIFALKKSRGVATPEPKSAHRIDEEGK